MFILPFICTDYEMIHNDNVMISQETADSAFPVYPYMCTAHIVTHNTTHVYHDNTMRIGSFLLYSKPSGQTRIYAQLYFPLDT